MRLLLIATCLLVLTLPSQAATIRVPADQPTIQAGLDAVAHGDTVLVACGIYYEHDIEMVSGVTLISETGDPNCVTIDAQQMGRVMSCIDLNSQTSIVGITASGGLAVVGGGVLCDYSSMRIQDCVFRDNFADEYGGGVTCRWGVLVLVNCLFQENSAGIACGGFDAVASSNVTVEGCVFWANSAGARGGGMCGSYGSTADLVHCTFYANSAPYVGGLVLHDGTADLANCIIASSPVGAAMGPYGDGGSASLVCCDLFGNAGGDWVDFIDDQYGINGNISQDPLLCDAVGGVFTIQEDSPCAPANSGGCELIGALPVGCATAAVATLNLPPRRDLLTVHPNPALSRVAFQFDGNSQGITLEIYDPQGKLIDLLEPHDSFAWTPGRSIPSGIYFARLRGGERRGGVKFVVLR